MCGGRQHRLPCRTAELRQRQGERQKSTVVFVGEGGLSVAEPVSLFFPSLLSYEQQILKRVSPFLYPFLFTFWVQFLANGVWIITLEGGGERKRRGEEQEDVEDEGRSRSFGVPAANDGQPERERGLSSSSSSLTPLPFL